MLTRKAWNVLVVDDEEDVHTVTQLALKHEKIDGLPVALHHAKSAAQALSMIGDRPHLTGVFYATAFVDVVMETDDAGLRLCQHIRAKLGDHMLQLILRTGQPGVAPPRQVMDNFNISGYLAKSEATQERLYIMLKAAVRQFGYLSNTAVGLRFQEVRSRAKSVSEFFELLERYLNRQFEHDPDLQLNAAWDLGERYIGCGYFRERSRYDALKPRLLAEGEEQLRKSRVRLIPNPMARVDDYVMVQTNVLRNGRTAMLVVKNPTVPAGQHEIVGVSWREQLAYLAELAS